MAKYTKHIALEEWCSLRYIENIKMEFLSGKWETNVNGKQVSDSDILAKYEI